MLAAAVDDEQTARRTAFYIHRTPEELYDLQRDPDSLTNHAADPAFRETVRLARGRLLAWMGRTGDPLLGKYREFLGEFAATTAD